MYNVYFLFVFALLSSYLVNIPIFAANSYESSFIEDQFFKKWQDNAAELYLSILKRSKSESGEKNTSFKFPEMANTVEHIQRDIQHRLAPSEARWLTTTQIDILQKIQLGFIVIERMGIPYARTVSLIYLYLDFMDSVFKGLCAELPGSIAKMLTENRFSNLTNADGDPLLFFSYKKLGIKFFVKTRSSPLYVIGLMDYPEFKDACLGKVEFDGYESDIGGFAHHDAEHARASWRVDSQLLKNGDYGTILQWQHNRDALLAKVDRLGRMDKDLSQAVWVILFEVLHERGLQFDLPLLKANLALPLYAKTAKDKWETGFWKPLPGKKDLYLFFDQAIEWLNHEVSNLIIEDNIPKLAQGGYAAFSNDKIRMAEGLVRKVEVHKEVDDVTVWLSETLDSESVIKNSLYNLRTFGLVTVDLADKDYVHLSGKSSFLQSKYNQLLKLWKMDALISHRIVESGQPIIGNFVRLDTSGKKACFSDDYCVDLDQLVLRASQKISWD